MSKSVKLQTLRRRIGRSLRAAGAPTKRQQTAMQQQQDTEVAKWGAAATEEARKLGIVQ